MTLKSTLATVAFATATVLALSASAGTGYPVGPLSNTATFFNGALGGQSGTVTITGATYNYNPAAGDLVMEVKVTNQDAVCNGCGNGYFYADYTGTDVVRSYFLTNVGAYGPLIGALQTQFNAGPTVGNADGGNCYPFLCNDSGVSVGPTFDYFEIYNKNAFGGPLAISSISFFQWPFYGSDTVLNGNYDITFSTLGGGVPEPASWALMLVGFGGLGAAMRRRRAVALAA